MKELYFKRFFYCSISFVTYSVFTKNLNKGENKDQLDENLILNLHELF